MNSARNFSEELIKRVPYRIYAISMDNGIQFTDLHRNRHGVTDMWHGHPFDRVGRINKIE